MRRKWENSILILGLVLMFLYACNNETESDLPESDLTEVPRYSVKTIVSGYEIIWGMDFIPDGDLLFNEKRGKLYRMRQNTITEVTGFPDVFSSGQGGLLDLKVHPDYLVNKWIYATYTAREQGNGSQLRLVRFRITGDQVRDIENIFSTDATNTWNGHFGSRILFDRNKYLFLSVGEGGSTSYGGVNSNNKNAQDPASPWGKIHRMKDDGTIPVDNPIIPGNTGPTTVYSYGHRNPQGLALHPETGRIWETEHGPKGGDEINIILSGANYGWPFYSLGVNYDGSAISSGHAAPGITQPLYTFTPSIGTSGTTFISSDKFKSWKGNLLVGGLASQKLYRFVINGNSVTEETVLLRDSGRVRNVIQSPDGSLLISVENPGRIIQIIPE